MTTFKAYKIEKLLYANIYCFPKQLKIEIFRKVLNLLKHILTSNISNYLRNKIETSSIRH